MDSLIDFTLATAVAGARPAVPPRGLKGNAKKSLRVELYCCTHTTLGYIIDFHQKTNKQLLSYDRTHIYAQR